jgi:peptidoglycan/LPS O-acetylase OafA/YrhL
MSAAQSRLGPINGLRGIAILSVVLHHLFGARFKSGWHAWRVGSIALPIFSPLSNGWQGVALFFMLSGFVLFLPYANGSRQMASPSDALRFYRARAARLLPLFYLNVAISTLLIPGLSRDVGRALRDLIMTATFTFPFADSTFHPPANWVLWSLGVEVWFSVLFPLLVVLRRRVGLTGLVFGSLIAWPIQYLALLCDLNPLLKDSVLGRLCDFVVGMALAELYARGRLPSRARVAAACAFGGAFILYLGFSVWDLAWTSVLPYNLIAFTGLLSDLGFALLLCGALGFAPLRRVVSTRPLQVLGMMCYSLYVWHGIAKMCFLGKEDIPEYRSFDLIVYLLLLAVVSTITYRFVEFGRVADWRLLFRGAPQDEITHHPERAKALTEATRAG